MEAVRPPAAVPAAQPPPSVAQPAVAPPAPEARPEPVAVTSASTTTRVTEPFLAAKHKDAPAESILPGKMTADAAPAAEVAAPVAATAAAAGGAGEKAEAAVAAALAGKMTMDAAATAASLAGKMTVDEAAAEAAKVGAAQELLSHSYLWLLQMPQAPTGNPANSCKLLWYRSLMLMQLATLKVESISV